MAKFLIIFSILLIAIWSVTLWQAGQREARALRDYPPLGNFVEVDGANVHYVQRGHGTDVVLIHGASGNLRDFTFGLVDKLATNYRVTVFDRPGLGYTDRINSSGATLEQQARLLNAAAHKIGVIQPIVVGQSYGGAVALAWSVYAQDSLSAMVLLASPSKPWTSDLSNFYKITSSWLGSRIVVPFLTAWVPDNTVDSAIEGIFAPQKAPSGYSDYVGAGLTLRRISLRANAAQRANLLNEIKEMNPLYAQINIPVELLHGDADTTVGLHIHSVPLAKELPTSNLTALTGIGHMPQHVSHAEIISSIDRAATRAGLR